MSLAWNSDKRRLDMSWTKGYIICYNFYSVFLDVVQVSPESNGDTLRGEKMDGD